MNPPNISQALTALRDQSPNQAQFNPRADYLLWLHKNRPDLYHLASVRLLAGQQFGKNVLGDIWDGISEVATAPLKLGQASVGFVNNLVGSGLNAVGLDALGNVITKPVDWINQKTDQVNEFIKKNPLQSIGAAASIVAAIPSGGASLYTLPFLATSAAVTTSLVTTAVLQRQQQQIANQTADQQKAINAEAAAFTATLSAWQPGDPPITIPPDLLPYMSAADIAAVQSLGTPASPNATVAAALQGQSAQTVSDAEAAARLVAANNGVSQSQFTKVFPFFANTPLSFVSPAVLVGAAVALYLFTR